ncbi:MAG: transglutaminase-like domain-containing protein [Anaerolineae bacterium]
MGLACFGDRQGARTARAARNRVEAAVAMNWLAWPIRKLGLSTSLTLALLLVVCITLAIEFEHLVRGLDSALVMTVGIAAALTGWLLARSSLPGRPAALLIVVIGAVFVFVRVGQLGNRLVALLGAITGFVWGLGAWLFNAPVAWSANRSLALKPLPPLDWKSGVDLLNAVTVLLSRAQAWIAGIIQGHPAFDPVGVALVWSLLVWLVLAWAGWAIRRRERPFEALLPTLALVAATLGYTGGGALALIPLLGSMLLLMVLVGHKAREHLWERSGIGFSEDIRIDIALLTVPLIALLLILAALFPSISAHDLAQSVQRAMREDTGDTARIPNSFGLQSAPLPTTVFESVRSPGLPNEHLIGHAPGLDRQVVMQITTDDLQPSPPEEAVGVQPPPRYYWRSSTYELYSGRGWYTGWTEVVEVAANQPAIQPAGFAGCLVRQTVHFVEPPPGALYTAGQLVSADQAYRIARRSGDDIFSANLQAATYHATSWIVTPSDQQLERAGTDYPDWVRATYLQLPSSVPARVLALARDLTATQPTPFARARALEAYLRTFPYTLDVPLPPVERDVADYFLFDLKRGYCDYYATAMVVLARAAGLPARLVVGYASGTYDAQTARFAVTQADAHAWVEIYFPDYGWVEFEPTAGRAAIDRQAEADRRYASSPPAGPPTSGHTSPGPLGRTDWLPGLAALFALAFAVVGWLAFDEWQLRQMTPAGTVKAIYGRMIGHARRLRVDVRPANTPHQANALLAQRLEELVGAMRSAHPPSGRAQAVSDAQYLARALADLYVETLYSPHAPDVMAQTRVIQAWSRLRSLLWRARWWQLTASLKNLLKASSKPLDNRRV